MPQTTETAPSRRQALDAASKAIIEQLQEDGRRPYAEIAKAVGLSEAATRQRVQKLVDQSGGFGTLLLQGHDWANPEATRRSYELFAQDVMPHFQGQAQPMIEASERARSVRQSKTDEHLNAVAQMTEKYNAELGRV